MPAYEFQLDISPELYLNYYRGVTRSVVVRSTRGLTVQFPALLLQRFITSEGIHGHFVLTCDENNKCTDLQRANAKP